MGLDEIIGGTGNGKAQGHGTGGYDGLWSGEFADTPASVEDRVAVIIPAADGIRQHGPARWAPRVDDAGGILMPMQGDDCLVGFDDQLEPWIITWWPSSYGS